MFTATFPFKYHTTKTEAERWRSQARSIRLSRDAKLRLEWFIYYKNTGNARATCRHFGIAPKTLYKWLSRFNPQYLESLEKHSCRPKSFRQTARTTEQESRMILLRREFPRYSAKKLSVIWGKRYQRTASAYQFEQVIQKYQLYYNAQRNDRIQKKRRRAIKKVLAIHTRFKKKPLKTFEIDTVVLHWDGVPHYMLTTVDRLSRTAFARMYCSHGSRAAADFLKRLKLLVGHDFALVPDNGSEFHGEFLRAAKELKIQLAWARVRQPKDKPQVERFNRTIQEEFVALGNNHLSIEQFNLRLTTWLIHYNFERPHQHLRYLAPLEWIAKFFPRVLPRCPVSTLI